MRHLSFVVVCIALTGLQPALAQDTGVFDRLCFGACGAPAEINAQ